MNDSKHTQTAIKKSGIRIHGHGLFLLYIRLLLISLVFGLAQNAMAHVVNQVVIIRYPIEFNHFRDAVAEFKAAMAQNGFMEGVNIEYIDILTRTADESSIPEVQEAVERYKKTASMFVTCGWVSLYARELLKNTNIPQLFLPVLDSVALKLVPSLTDPPNTNITGIYLKYPAEKVTRLTANLMHGIKHFAYVYDSRIPADAVYKSSFERIPKNCCGFTIHYLDLSKGIDNILTTLKTQQIQAMCFIVGGFQHLKKLKSANIPIVSPFTLDMDEESVKIFLKDDDTILAGLFNPFSICGSQAGEMASAILQGADIKQIIPRPAKQKVFVNMKAAKRFGIQIPLKILETVDYVIK
ncbi:MAG: ABC transporter substrate binding protein [Dissulfuribacterales bacterium]